MKLRVNVAEQSASLLDDAGVVIRRYPVSTATNGVGEVRNSYCTPRGRHIVRAKIGANAPLNTVFVRRRPTGEMYDEELHERWPERDWILTRIFWLSGCEIGRNRLGRVDTMQRFIYIHGTPESTVLGQPGSHGCIRMSNRDIIELFDIFPLFGEVEIVEFKETEREGKV